MTQVNIDKIYRTAEDTIRLEELNDRGEGIAKYIYVSVEAYKYLLKKGKINDKNQDIQTEGWLNFLQVSKIGVTKLVNNSIDETLMRDLLNANPEGSRLVCQYAIFPSRDTVAVSDSYDYGDIDGLVALTKDYTMAWWSNVIFCKRRMEGNDWKYYPLLPHEQQQVMEHIVIIKDVLEAKERRINL